MSDRKKAARKAPPTLRDCRTDLANAERFVRMCSDGLDSSIRFVPHWRKWLIWDGKRWALDHRQEIYQFAEAIPASIYEEAAAAADEKSRTALAGWARKSENLTQLKNAITLAEKQPGIATLPEELDRDRWVFNVLNGTINLRDGQLHSAYKTDLLTKLSPIEYSAEATCPRWDRFLLEIMDGSVELAAFLARATGYSLTGETSERVVFLLFGGGANGKSVFLSVLAEVLGDYATWTAPTTLMAKRGDSIPNDIAALKGVRLVATSETERGRNLAESLLKQMTGGTDMLSARFMRGEFFQFRPEFKIWLATNSKPIIRGRDLAIWSRIHLIPFTQQFYRQDEDGMPKQDTSLIDALKLEAGGILRWAIQGCLQWQAQGLCPPDAVRAATQEYRSEMDTLARFLDEHCTFLPDLKASSASLQQAYRDWCKKSGEEPVSPNELGSELRLRGCEPVKINRGRGWKGVGLIGGES